MLPAVLADTSGHIRGVGAVLQITAAAYGQGFLECFSPFLVGFCEPPNLIGRESQVAKQTAERLASVERVQELLPELGW
jgi:hypothetical protein